MRFCLIVHNAPNLSGGSYQVTRGGRRVTSGGIWRGQLSRAGAPYTEDKKARPSLD